MQSSPKSPPESDPSEDGRDRRRKLRPLFEDTERYFNGGGHQPANGNSPFAVDESGVDARAAENEEPPAHANPIAASLRNQASTESATRSARQAHHDKAASAAPGDEARSAAANSSSTQRLSRVWALFALVIGAAAMWFLVGELTTASSMQGATVGNLIHLRAGAPGVISDVAIAESDEVDAGQVIARMDAGGLQSQLDRFDDILALKELEAAQVSSAIEEERQRLALLHEISKRTEAMLQLEIDELSIQLELATELASELDGSVKRGSAKKFEFLEAESNRLRVSKRHEEKLGELELQQLITTHAAAGRHYHAGVVRSWLDELQLHATKVATEIGQTQLEAATLRTELDHSTIATHRAGRVFAIHHHPGSSVQAGDPLVTLETDDRVWIIASFKYREAEDIAYGDRAEIELPSIEQTIGGTVVAIGHSVISATDADSPFLRLTPEEVLVKIEPDVSIDDLHSGISAQVRVRTHGFAPLAWVGSLVDLFRPQAEPEPAEQETDSPKEELTDPGDSVIPPPEPPESKPQPMPAPIDLEPPLPPPFPGDPADKATSVAPANTTPERDTIAPMNNPFDLSHR